MYMHNPPPPSEILREDVLPDLGLSVTQFAKHLGYSREAISRILHGKAPITPQLAWRLEQAGLSTAEMWVKLQAKYDIWQIKNKPEQQKITPIIHHEPA